MCSYCTTVLIVSIHHLTTLSINSCATNQPKSKVRSYAVDTLAAAPDGELVLYLLQLVQALKYETLNAEDNDSGGVRSKQSLRGSSSSNSSAAGKSNTGGGSGNFSSLGTFLIERAVKNIELANYLYWYVDGACMCIFSLASIVISG